MKLFDISAAKEAYKTGGNVSEILRKQIGSCQNTSDVIEIAYDLQAGSYIRDTLARIDQLDSLVGERAAHLEKYISSGMSILDVGCGELTKLALILNKLASYDLDVFAFDLSWSRLYLGQNFFQEHIDAKLGSNTFFSADMDSIPLPTNSIDVVTSNHSLEPNGKTLALILEELFRVARSYCVLFEPHYGLCDAEGKARMEKLGYIKNIEETVAALGGVIIDVVPMINIANRLNPTACFVIEPPRAISQPASIPRFTAPGTDYLLSEEPGYLGSKNTGLLFPILRGIPMLKKGNAILANSYFDLEERSQNAGHENLVGE